MILSGNEIIKQVKKGNIKINPFNKNQINPNSYNLKLDDELLIYDNQILDLTNNNKTTKIEIPFTGLTLIPGKIYLAKTLEYTETNNFVPMIEGRSSLARLGLFIHITAGFGDIGFKGCWTLEISCIQPIKIYPNIEICQIYFNTVKGNTSIKYKGKYQNSLNIESSKMYKEFKTK